MWDLRADGEMFGLARILHVVALDHSCCEPLADPPRLVLAHILNIPRLT